MSPDLKVLETRALALPVKQRGDLAERLLASLDCADDPEAVERAWIEEAERRDQEYPAGGVEAIPFDDAIAALRAGLRTRAPGELRQIANATLALPPEVRGRFAERLLASLEEEADDVDLAAVERAWIEEAKRRRERYLAGATGAVSAEEALARAFAGVRRT